MRAKVFMAWVNMIPKWRVYYDQELIATYEQEDWAQKYADYLNTQGGNK
jgi:hypothetical protein